VGLEGLYSFVKGTGRPDTKAYSVGMGTGTGTGIGVGIG
jgi:hypothetical protein